MRRLRRPLVWLPLVVLTLFFAACGWRNWHLSMDNRSVWLEGALYSATHVRERKIIAFAAPEDARLLEREWKQRHQNVPIEVVPVASRREFKATELMSLFNSKRDASWLKVDTPKLGNRFHATINISYGDFGSGSEGQFKAMRLTRSPLTFWDNSWHIASVHETPIVASSY